MYRLKARWEYEAKENRGYRAIWWLTRVPANPCPNRAYIGELPTGEWELRIWDSQKAHFEPHVIGTDLKALKAIGRIEAARRVNDELEI